MITLQMFLKVLLLIIVIIIINIKTYCPFDILPQNSQWQQWILCGGKQLLSMTPTSKTQEQIPSTVLFFLNTLLGACSPLCCAHHQAHVIPALTQSRAVPGWTKLPSPVAGIAGPSALTSHGKRANAAFKFREGKLKPVSSHTWISDE